MVATPILSSDRLRLAPLQETDVSPDYVGWLNDPSINQYLETRHSPQNAESCRDFVSSCAADPGTHLFGIFVLKNGRHVGNIKVGPIDIIHGTADVSLLIGAHDLHGQGIGTEVIGMVSEWALGPLGLARVAAGCYESNLGSLRAFMKCGYRVEGFLPKARLAADGQRTGLFLMAKLAES